ncbi:MAG: ParB/RepB/Spo0J family partition protein [Deltaproteobacteria bacterium]|nr:ParB/RepB/Spo0J family partition protein [Deltaproteobacteria bacterium]
MESIEGRSNQIPVELIDPNPWQPRKGFSEKYLLELARSLTQDGVLQPLVVSKNKANPGRYVLVAGERRLRAAKIAGLESVPVVFRDDLKSDDQLRLALIENIQRRNLNAIEEAEAYKCLIDQFGYTQEECALRVGKERPSITHALRLLTLPREIQLDVITGRLSGGHARAIAGAGDKKRMLEARDKILNNGLNVRDAEELCKKLREQSGKDTLRQDPNLDYVADTLRTLLRTKVKIKGRGKNGRIEIYYFSPSEFERILDAMGCRI